jgi:predicted cupin superfamily sugar epimerase
MTAERLIQHLQLKPHPEGGFYREVYRSAGTIDAACLQPVFDGSRHYATSIYYLLQRGDFSAFHRIRSDEIWHFYAGGTLWLHLVDKDARYQRLQLGNTLTEDTEFQVVMPAGVWFSAEPAPGTLFTLAGCTVAPGFDFRDFEMADKEKLSLEFPQHREIIQRLCR